MLCTILSWKLTILILCSLWRDGQYTQCYHVCVLFATFWTFTTSYMLHNCVGKNFTYMYMYYTFSELGLHVHIAIIAALPRTASYFSYVSKKSSSIFPMDQLRIKAKECNYFKWNVTPLPLYFLQPFCTAYVWRVFNGNGYGFWTSQTARTYHIYKTQPFSKEVEYLTRLSRKEQNQSVEACARTRYILDWYQIHCRSLLLCNMAMNMSQIAVRMLLQR